MTFHSTAVFSGACEAHATLTFRCEDCPVGQALLVGSVVHGAAPAGLVGAASCDPLGLPAHISYRGYRSPIAVVLCVLKYGSVVGRAWKTFQPYRNTVRL